MAKLINNPPESIGNWWMGILDIRGIEEGKEPRESLAEKVGGQ